MRLRMQVGRNKGKHQIRGNDQKSYPDFTIDT